MLFSLTYYQWLMILGGLFVVLERTWPRVSGQRLFRAGWLSDVAYIVFNSKYLGMLIGYVTVLWLPQGEPAGGRLAGAWPWWAQFAALLITADLVKWLIHNLLHRVPVLWEFHKVHHSIVDMDWLGDWRFHWFEILIYNALLYAPTVVLGVAPEMGLAVGVVDTLIGHFAHANLRWKIGWLKYVINSPEMHLWHHNHPACGPVNRNFALTLSIWDWLFGTAYVAAHAPARLGFDGIEGFPTALPGQWIAPFRKLMHGR